MIRKEGGIHEQANWCRNIPNSIFMIQHSLSASCHHWDNKTVVLQTLSGRHHTPVSCSVWTLFSRPASVEERQEGKQASEKQGNETRNVQWNKVKNVKHAVRLTHMHLCRMSSAWVSAFCSIVIRLRCKVSLKDPNKNLDTSWTDQESGRSGMTCSAVKTPGLLLSRSTVALMRPLEFRYIWSRVRNKVCLNCESLPCAALKQKASAASGSWPWRSIWSASEYLPALPRRIAFSLCRNVDLTCSETGKKTIFQI